MAAEENVSGVVATPAIGRRERAQVPSRVQVRFEQAVQAARALRAYSMNFAIGGLCLRTQKGYEVGAPLLISLTVEGMEFRLAGTVAWTRGDAVGVRFEDLPEDDRLRLTELLATLRR